MNNTTTPAVSKHPSNVIICDICHREFTLTRDSLEEKEVVLEKEGLDPKDATITVLTCPCCGKHYPVILDDEETSGIASELREVIAKEYKASSKGKQPAQKLIRKHQTLRKKLSFKRQRLAEKFNGSFYQTEDGKEQLDYHYHV